jgi:hypothetical protein
MAQTTLGNWDWTNNHVQADLQGGQFVNAATTMIAAGPPRLGQTNYSRSLENAGKNVAFPIGIIENFGLNQNKMIQKMFEIGSKRAYHIPGRTVGAITLGRILYWGPSLMRVLYAYYPVASMRGFGHKVDEVEGSDQQPGSATPTIKDPPGYGKAFSGSPGNNSKGTENAQNTDFFINLASDLFDHPLGLMIYMRDAQNDAYGAFYLEDTYLQAHSFNINASSILIAEGVSAQYDRLLPININP